MSPEMRIAPITPEQARTEHYIPDEITQIVNDLLAERAGSRMITIKQKEIVERAEALGLNRRTIYDNHWLDFEDRFRSAGWEVDYDKPGFNEDYDAFFEFRAAQ